MSIPVVINIPAVLDALFAQGFQTSAALPSSCLATTVNRGSFSFIESYPWRKNGSFPPLRMCQSGGGTKRSDVFVTGHPCLSAARDGNKHPAQTASENVRKKLREFTQHLPFDAIPKDNPNRFHRIRESLYDKETYVIECQAQKPYSPD